MSALSVLSITTAKPFRAVNSKERRRQAVLRYLEEQKEFATADLEGRPFRAVKRAFRTDTLGDRIPYETERKVRRGWFSDADGVVYFTVRYQLKVVALSKAGSAVKVGKLEDLPAVIDTLVQAVNEGALDRQLEAAFVEHKARCRRGVIRDAS